MNPMSIQQDIVNLNLDALRLARELARKDPLDAVYRFGLDMESLDELSNMTTDDIRQIAAAGRLRLLFPKRTPENMSKVTHVQLLGRSDP